MVLGFTSQHSLHFNLVPKMMDLARELAKDPAALTHLKLGDGTTASYKTNYGLSKTFRDKLVESLKVNCFSLNLDEAFTSNNKKILAILVSYFDSEIGSVVTHHLDCIELKTVKSETLFVEICRLFEKYDLPWANLCTVLMDSCNVMRGSKSGLEVRMLICWM